MTNLKRHQGRTEFQHVDRIHLPQCVVLERRCNKHSGSKRAGNSWPTVFRHSGTVKKSHNTV